MRSPVVQSLAKIQVWAWPAFSPIYSFMSKQEGNKVVKRPRRFVDNGLGAPAPYPDPLEPRREVCELNPDCDELADHIGFQDAYQRFYGTPA
uniref:Osteocalcin n=1 Tax=Spermophilus dauricus TaxID=99837 RepID=A0A8C9UVK2_SPEDA